MGIKTIISFTFLGLLALTFVVVLFQQVSESIAEYREEHPGEKILTTTNFLAFIGAMFLLWFFNVVVASRFTSH